MPMYMTEITNQDGSQGRLYGEYADGLAAAHQAKAKFPKAARIVAETYASWRTRTITGNVVHHDTEHLPCGGFYFAPGVEDLVPRYRWGTRPVSALGRAVLWAIKILAIAGAIGGGAAWLQVKGWPL